MTQETISPRENHKGPFILPNHSAITSPNTHWSRDTLYNSSRSEIGLAWSIFKVHGTPNENIWPEWKALPQSQTLIFNNVDGKGLTRELLPHLMPEEEGKGNNSQPQATIVDLMSRFLRYPYRARLSFADALVHPWFTKSDTILISSGYGSVFERHWDSMFSTVEADERLRLSVEKVWKPGAEDRSAAKVALETRIAEVWNGKTMAGWLADLFENH